MISWINYDPFWNKGCGVSAVSAHLTNKHVVSNWRCDRSHSPRRDSHLHPPHLPSGSRPSPPPPGEVKDAVMSPLTWMMLDVHTALHSFHFSPASGVWRGTGSCKRAIRTIKFDFDVVLNQWSLLWTIRQSAAKPSNHLKPAQRHTCLTGFINKDLCNLTKQPDSSQLTRHCPLITG